MELLNYKEFINRINEGSAEEGDGITVKEPKKDKEEDKDAEKSIYPEKDKKTGEKTIDKTKISKDAIVNGLAKELYNAQYRALTIQFEIDRTIEKMTKENPDDPALAQFTASSALQQANAQMRADTIEAQMMAAAAASPKLTQTATELAAEAKNLALKAALELFDKQMAKLRGDNKKDEK